ALQSPRPLDERLIDAYQARRVLDRIVGYKLSPLLWSKVRAGLSAGRVQSVALRLICDREQEINNFVPEEYWSITGTFALPPSAPGAPESPFVAKLIQRAGKRIHIPDEATAKAILAELRDAQFTVAQVKRGQRRRNPAPPFITSTLQQEASRKLGFSAQKTMTIAQQLYEGLDVGPEGTVGLIPYMRTDSTRVAEEAQREAQRFIDEHFGREFRPDQPPRYRTREGAQAAHEAIRPTSVYRTPEMVKPYLRRDQYRLYQLIWERFVASQMAPAVLDTLTVDVAAGEYLFRATGSSVRFPGFMTLYTEGVDE